MERGQRALGVLGQLKSYAEFLANVRGRRKAMVLFSEGIDYPVHDIFAAHEATNVLRATEDAIAAAARANVNIFTVDPRGLVGLTSEYIELNRSNSELFNIGARDPRFGMQPQTALLAEMRQTQDSLRTLAEETGGLAAIDTNSFASSFDRIVQANSLYYMLGYYPADHPQDGRFHKIEVRVDRPGLRILARKGYASPRARTLSRSERDRVERERLARTKGADQTSTELRAMLDSPIQQGGVGLDVQAAAFKGAARNASVALAIEVDGSRLQFAPPKDNGVFVNVVELSLYGINAQGKPLQGLRTALDLTLRPDTLRPGQEIRPPRQPAHRAAAWALSAAHRRSRKRRRRDGHGVLRPGRPGFRARALDHERLAADGSVGSARVDGPGRQRGKLFPARRPAAAPSRPPTFSRCTPKSTPRSARSRAAD